MGPFKDFKQHILSKPYYRKDLFLENVEQELKKLYSTILQEASTKTHLIPFYQSLINHVDELECSLKDEFDNYVEIPQINDLISYAEPKDEPVPEPVTLDELFHSEKYNHYLENPKGDSYQEFLNQKFQITFTTITEFFQFYNSMKYQFKCLIISENLSPLRAFINQEIVKCYSKNIETIKTSLTVDQIAMLANLFHRDFAPETDKAVLQRIISSFLIPKNSSKPVSVNNLTNRMKDGHLYSEISRENLKAIIESWLKSPHLTSS